MRSAAAKMSCQSANHRVPVGAWFVQQDGADRHHDAVDAITALRGLEIKERLADDGEKLLGAARLRVVTALRRFDGRDVRTNHRRYGDIAGLYGPSIDQNCTCSAVPAAAAKAGTHEIQILSQNVEKRSGRVGIDDARLTIDLQCE